MNPAHDYKLRGKRAMPQHKWDARHFYPTQEPALAPRYELDFT